LWATVHHVAWKRLVKIDPSRPEVIGAHTLNCRPKFKLLHFLGGGVYPVLIGVCANKSWSISNACKKLRGQQPLRAEM